MKKSITLNEIFGLKKQKTSLYLTVLFVFIFTINSFAQGGTCSNIEPFCAGNEALIFPNCNVNEPTCTQDADSGPDYACLGSQPWPAWFYLQIDQPGDLSFDIVQNSQFDANGNPIGTGLDVDFIAWGPFAQGDDLCDYTQLQSFNEIGCSFSAAPIESFTIPNGQTGEIYVLLITNYDEGAGFIKLFQTGGTGTTNCEIVLTCDVTIDGGDQTFCDVSETTLTTATSGPVQSYQWYFNNSIINGATNDNLLISESGAYKVIVDGVDCDQPIEDEVQISIPGLLSVDLGESQIFCDVSSFEIIPLIDGNSTNASYLWSTGETSPTIVVTESGEYNVVITSENCSVTDTISLAFGISPAFDLGENFETCFEETIVLDATPSNLDLNTATYLWSTGETTATIVVVESGDYSVIVTGTENCFTEDSINISGRTDLNITLEDDFKSCVGEEWTLTASTNEENITYQWYLNGDEIYEESGSTLDIVVGEDFSGTQTYSVTITKGECTGSDEVDISLYDIGNCVITQGISPNGTPGFNDNLNLEVLNDRIGISKIQLFNRFGTLVYEQDNYINEWFGQDSNGNELPTGTYYYVLDLLGVDDVYGQQPTGWIYLNRDAN